MLLAQIDAASAAQFPLESVSLVEIARDVVSLLAPGIIAEGKAITLDAGSGHPVARGRREAIAAALRNLIENAVRVTPTGSTVTIRVGPDPEIGRAQVCTPVTNAHLVCSLLLEKTKQTNINKIRK